MKWVLLTSHLDKKQEIKLSGVVTHKQSCGNYIGRDQLKVNILARWLPVKLPSQVWLIVSGLVDCLPNGLFTWSEVRTKVQNVQV